MNLDKQQKAIHEAYLKNLVKRIDQSKQSYQNATITASKQPENVDEPVNLIPSVLPTKIFKT